MIQLFWPEMTSWTCLVYLTDWIQNPLIPALGYKLRHGSGTPQETKVPGRPRYDIDNVTIWTLNAL